MTARGLAGVNLIATPGLGTILAGRWLAGLCQLAFAGSGFLLIMLWFWTLFKGMVGGGSSGPAWEWQFGVALFAGGWFGSLWSSLDIVRQASAQTPPKLDGTPG